MPPKRPARRKLVLVEGMRVRVQGSRGKIFYDGPERRNLAVVDRRKALAWREVKEDNKGRIIKQEWMDEAKQKCINANKGTPDPSKWIFRPAIEKKKGKARYIILFDPRENKFYGSVTNFVDSPVCLI